jgi:hypothetical protein
VLRLLLQFIYPKMNRRLFPLLNATAIGFSVPVDLSAIRAFPAPPRTVVQHPRKTHGGSVLICEKRRKRSSRKLSAEVP